jgi:hypothetical protein
MSAKIRISLALCLAAALAAVPFARGATANVVISQVFAGGGNSGAPYTNDFVELFNRGSAPVTITGWSVQYASAASTSWQATPLTGTIQPGKYFLVQLASAAAVGAPLPAPDVSGTTNLAASGGKIALVRDATALACGATAGSCAPTASIEDFLGYGAAADYEGAAAADALSNTTAAIRAGGGCTDTNANAADYTTGAPAPRNSASTGATCAGTTPTSSVSGSAAVDLDLQPVLSIALERSTISFGRVFAGDTPPPVSERITVVSNSAGGYSLTTHRSAFSPADVPLAIAAPPTAAFVPVPIAPAADLLLASTTSPSAATGDVWPTSVGFAGPLPALPPGHYTATITFTVIAR